MSGVDEGLPGASWSMDLRGTSAPALVEVRRWVSRTLGEVGDPHLDDLLLVATELVTNAYDHGGGAIAVRMKHTARPCRVRIEVEDNGLGRPVIRPPSNSRPGGRGMVLVDKLADWGVIESFEAASKTVWAEVSCDGVGAIPRAAVARR
ncbi:ATP-binding protein [Amycolatopsis regifaucium]|uniref:ATP-binding protein n=1 Tax=Amycolatopsis regifaucium TaxID=546365 RepID=A0A154MLP1_9PSEU|nr:ATP-binding protein [Amycolatopsis regifaucium]KZB84777.1 ATPase [Amycolatopsis regifaucium]OKA05240.1 ATP-binding protein [Amycolatopsis regifaucium]SFJ63572.1 Anti-sigma regulatory factor (Ser/Thr protein kinase) [Amycolatopsis regifaucium]